MASVAIGLFGLQNWFNGDFSHVVDLVKRADEKGVDQVSLTDHVVMGENTHEYPYGKFPAPSDYPWFEPSRWTPYFVSLPGKAVVRCNPVTAPKGCEDGGLGN